MSKEVNQMSCPALKRIIDFGYCQELQMASDDGIIWEGMEDRFKENQIIICKKCPKRIDPALD